MTDAETINQTVNFLHLIGGATSLKKVATCEGGELAGPCPFCGGVDRFRVQPNHPEGGRWFCRGCGGNKWHSVIDYVMKRDGVEFIKAMQTLEGPQEQIITKIDKPIANPEKWGDAAYKFIEESVAYLWTDEGVAARKYLHNRGLKDETLKYWAIGFNPFEGYGNSREWGVAEKVFLPRGIVIPCWKTNLSNLVYLKIRRSSGEPRYTNVKGGHQWLYGGFTYQDAGTGFLFESELDVLLAHQTGLGCGYASMPAGQKLHGEYFQYFKTIHSLIVALDNDDAGNKAADDLCKRSKYFIKAERFPAGKDLTEYYQSTRNMNGVTEWLYTQLGLVPHE